MSTWTSRRFVLWLCLAVLTAACDEGGGVFGTSSGSDPASSLPDDALRSARLADGEVTIVPPPGFCLDESALRPDFAVLARCDSLGARASVPDAPLGMITVSIAEPADAGLDLVEALAALTPATSRVIGRRGSDDLALLRLQGQVPEGADPRYWRGLARIGPHLLSLTAHAPSGGDLAGATGARLLGTLVRQSRQASAPRVAAVSGAPVSD